MKVSEIIEVNAEYIKILEEFVVVLRSTLKMTQINDKRSWEEAAKKSESKVVKCLYEEYIEQQRLYRRFLDLEMTNVNNERTEECCECNDSLPVILSEDDKFFLIKALESGGIEDIKSLYDWANRRMKGWDVGNVEDNKEK